MKKVLISIAISILFLSAISRADVAASFEAASQFLNLRGFGIDNKDQITADSKWKKKDSEKNTKAYNRIITNSSVKLDEQIKFSYDDESKLSSILETKSEGFAGANHSELNLIQFNGSEIASTTSCSGGRMKVVIPLYFHKSCVTTTPSFCSAIFKKIGTQVYIDSNDSENAEILRPTIEAVQSLISEDLLKKESSNFSKLGLKMSQTSVKITVDSPEYLSVLLFIKNNSSTSPLVRIRADEIVRNCYKYRVTPVKSSAPAKSENINGIK